MQNPILRESRTKRLEVQTMKKFSIKFFGSSRIILNDDLCSVKHFVTSVTGEMIPQRFIDMYEIAVENNILSITTHYDRCQEEIENNSPKSLTIKYDISTGKELENWFGN